MKTPTTFASDQKTCRTTRRALLPVGLSTICAIACLATMHGMVAESAAGVAPEGIKLTASDGQTNDLFGTDVAIDSGIAVVGARHNGEMGFSSGAAYVYVRDGSNWVQQAKLTASDGSRGAEFGQAVAISFQIIVVGAPSAAVQAGAAYVFVRDGTNWVEQAKLTGVAPLPKDLFGFSVAIEANTIIVGVPGEDGHCPMRPCDTGSAYVFVRSGTNWVRGGNLTDSEGAKGDRFGTRVVLSGNTLAIAGSSFNDTNSVHVFVRQAGRWVSQAKLVPDDGAKGFGSSIAIQGNRLIVGANQDDSSVFAGGSAYVFERTGTNWMQKAKLEPSNPGFGSTFGSGVALSGNQALIGAPGAVVDSKQSGAAYVFEHNGTSWMEQEILTPNPPDNQVGAFGRAVALHAGTALAGQVWNNTPGWAYLFPLSPPPGVTIHRVDPTASEPGTDTAQFKVTRTGNTDEALRVFYGVGGSATPGLDYARLPGFATIAAGQTSALFKVNPIDDVDPEEAETVKVTLLPDPAYNLVRPFRANITILDDDSTP